MKSDISTSTLLIINLKFLFKYLDILYGIVTVFDKPISCKSAAVIPKSIVRSSAPNCNKIFSTYLLTRL